MELMLREPLKIASQEGWFKARQQRTQQNHVVRRVSLRSTHPTFELLEVPLMVDIELVAVGCVWLVRSQLQVLEKIRNVDRRRVSWPELA